MLLSSDARFVVPRLPTTEASVEPGEDVDHRGEDPELHTRQIDRGKHVRVGEEEAGLANGETMYRPWRFPPPSPDKASHWRNRSKSIFDGVGHPCRRQGSDDNAFVAPSNRGRPN